MSEFGKELHVIKRRRSELGLELSHSPSPEARESSDDSQTALAEQDEWSDDGMQPESKLAH